MGICGVASGSGGNRVCGGSISPTTTTPTTTTNTTTTPTITNSFITTSTTQHTLNYGNNSGDSGFGWV